MRLLIDCYKLVKGAGKSIGIYNLTGSIITHLAATLPEKPECEEIIVLGNEYNQKDFDVPGVTFVKVPGNPLNKINMILWELFRVPVWAKKYHADRILFPRGYRPLFCSVKDTIIVHDLIPFYYHKYFPDTFNKLENAYIMNRLKASIRRANRVITISEYSLKEMEEMCPGCRDRVHVIYNGYNDVSCPEDGKFKEVSPPDNGNYLFAVTSGLPHKNAAGILKAYDSYYQQALRKKEKPLSLLAVGIEGTEGYSISEEAAKHVTCYKFIKDFGDMCLLLKGARAFLFLSYMEGFGFPPLEAMQLGVPVVCSDRSSLPEVVKDAGILVDPDDFEAVTKALERVVSDEALREKLIEKGYQNIRRFSWESRTELYWEEMLRK